MGLFIWNRNIILWWNPIKIVIHSIKNARHNIWTLQNEGCILTKNFVQKKPVTKFDRVFDRFLQILAASKRLQKSRKFLTENKIFWPKTGQKKFLPVILTDRSQWVKEDSSPVTDCDRLVAITGKTFVPCYLFQFPSVPSFFFSPLICSAPSLLRAPSIADSLI